MAAGEEKIDIGALVGLVKEQGVSLRPGPANKDTIKWDKICASYKMISPKRGGLATPMDLKRAYYSLETTKETKEDCGPTRKRPRVSQANLIQVSKLQCSTDHWDLVFEDLLTVHHCDFNSLGANIMLRSEDGYQVALHEYIFLKQTKILECLGSQSDIDSYKDAFGNVAIILAGVHKPVLKALVELLYVGKAVVDSNELAEEVQSFLADNIKLAAETVKPSIDITKGSYEPLNALAKPVNDVSFLESEGTKRIKFSSSKFRTSVLNDVQFRT